MSFHADDSHDVIAFIGWVGKTASEVNTIMKNSGLKRCVIKQMTLQSENRHLHCVGIPLKNLGFNEGHFSTLSLDIFEIGEAKRQLIIWCRSLNIRKRFNLHIIGQHKHI